MTKTALPRTTLAHPPAPDASATEKLRWALSFAVLAPSKHNTQPWLFELTGESVDLYCDTTRALTVSDPYGREMLISCGAALAGLRLGIRALGCVPTVHVFPQPGKFSHLARVGLGAERPVDAAEQRLIDAVPRRQTQRLSLDGGPVPMALLLELSDVAQAEGAHLQLLTTREARRGIAALVHSADLVARGNPALQQELRDWVRPTGSPAHDGIPQESCGIPDDASDLLARSFDPVSAPPGADVAADRPEVAVLWTDRDEPSSWITAGQALHMVLLRATADDVHASFINQPIEVGPLRRQIGEELGVRGSAQMLVRFGWGVGAVSTPRRPIDDVIVVPARTAALD